MNREDIIKMAMDADGHINSHARGIDMGWDGIARFAALVAAAERDACAKVCESRQTPGTGSVAILNGAADAIRARGQA
jgi:hypothetical protein